MRGLRAAWICAALALGAGAAGAQVADLRSTTALRVCADPAAEPMSLEDGTGFIAIERSHHAITNSL